METMTLITTLMTDSSKTEGMSTPTEGVLYIASGEEYLREAHRSVRSLKSSSGDLHTTLFTDSEVESAHFDDIRPIENPDHTYADSILVPSMSPYDRTLFLDTDTYICDDISGMFSLLDRFDIAAAHNPGSRTATAQGGYLARDVPHAFPQYNTGVILYRDTEPVSDLFIDWRETYEANKSETISGLNQPAFREALYRSSLDIATLPSEYNLRVRYDGSVGFMTDTVKIVHGRHPAGLPSIAERLNAKEGMRVFTMNTWPLKVTTKNPGLRYYIPTILTEDYQPYTYRGRFLNSLRSRGLVDTLSRIKRDLRTILD